MDTNTHSKLIMAVVQEDDYDATVSQLNKNGFFVTMLSSPGGTTIEGVCSLEANGFETALCKAFDAVYEKDKRL